jgi:hypothetical protein
MMNKQPYTGNCGAKNLPCIHFIIMHGDILVAHIEREFLATDPEVLGWIPGATRFSEK